MMTRTLNLGLNAHGATQPRRARLAQRVSVLMYHAVIASPGDTIGADAHYSVTSARFAQHLRSVLARGSVPSSVLDLLDGGHRHPAATGAAVAFTFDDGHISHLAAAQTLARAGARADFFVNPGQVGEAGLLDWTALRDMASMGMSIQSHGWMHRHLNTLSPGELRETLVRSKQEIEDRLGTPVTLFAPPGGRTVPQLAALATSVGYRAVCSSRSGVWSTAQRGAEVPRLAVLASTSQRQFERWVDQHAGELGRQWMRERLLRSAKQVLGGKSYERARQALLGRQPPAQAIGPHRG